MTRSSLQEHPATNEEQEQKTHKSGHTESAHAHTSRAKRVEYAKGSKNELANSKQQQTLEEMTMLAA